MRILLLICLAAFVSLLAPAHGQSVPDGPTRQAMIASFNRVGDIEKKANAIVRPADGTPRFTETIVARDEALEKLRIELVKSVMPQIDAIKLPPFNVSDAGIKATYTTREKLRALASSLNECIAQRQHWLGTGRRGGLEAVASNLRKQCAQYDIDRDTVRKALLGP